MAGNFTTEQRSKGGKRGSRKGVPNKTTTEIRMNFQNLIATNLPEMKVQLTKLLKEHPEKGFKVITDLARFVLPTLAKIDGDIKIVEQPLLPDRYNKIIDITKQEN